MVSVTIIIIITVIISQLPVAGVANISVLMLFLGSLKQYKEKHKNYNYGILIQIFKRISHTLKDLKWMLWDAEDTFYQLNARERFFSIISTMLLLG